MENGNGHNYENDNTHELSPLLLVPMLDDAQTAKRSRSGKRFLALLLVVSAAAAAAMTVLMYGSLSVGGTPITSSFSPVLGNGRKQGESCDNIWWNACGDKLSCYDNGRKQYCVPMGELNACCGWWYDKEAAGIDCGKGMQCDDRKKYRLDITPMCHPINENKNHGRSYYAKAGSCNVNTGEPANILVEIYNRI